MIGEASPVAASSAPGSIQLDAALNAPRNAGLRLDAESCREITLIIRVPAGA